MLFSIRRCWKHASPNSRELDRAVIVLIYQHSHSRSGFYVTHLNGHNTFLTILLPSASFLTNTLIFLKLHLKT